MQNFGNALVKIMWADNISEVLKLAGNPQFWKNHKGFHPMIESKQ
jgi:hypothetical protein